MKNPKIQYGARPETNQEWFYKSYKTHTEAIEITNGTIMFTVGGQWHRENGPAVIRADGSVFWCMNGQPHRLDGPAYIRIGKPSQWFVRGVDITKEVREWMKESGVRTDWQKWGDVEKVAFKLRFS